MTRNEFCDYRDAWGLSDSEMGAFLGVTANSVQRYVAGSRKVSSATERLIKLVAAMGWHPLEAIRTIEKYEATHSGQKWKVKPA